MSRNIPTSKDIFTAFYTVHQFIKGPHTHDERDLKVLVHVLKNIFQCDLFSIFYFDPTVRKLKLRYLEGKPVSFLDRIIFQLGRGAAQWIANRRKTLYVADLSKKLATPAPQKYIKSFIGVPIIVNGNLIGALILGSFTPQHFRKADMWVLEIFSTLLSAYFIPQHGVEETIHAVNHI